MRGVGGPLLCIGDLLADVGESGEDHQYTLHSAATISDTDPASPARLQPLFEENYGQLKKALTGTEPTDHSWTVQTLKLCSALNTADKLVQSANSNALTVAERIVQLEKILERGDLAVESIGSIIRTQE